MKFDIEKDLKEVLEKHHDIYVLDFGGDTKYDKTLVKKVLIGCEGGFSEQERELFAKFKKISFETKNILKSETAAVSMASKILI